MTISAFGLTDVGKKRRHNEDAYLLDVERGLFVVADGMGGHAAGEVASRITVESIQEFIAGTEEEHENTWPFGFNNRYSLEGNRLTTAVEKANEKVMRAVQNRPELKGMGTTVVAALFDQDRVTLVHVGDSRAYLFRGKELKRLTDDHSWVQEQVNAGILSEDEAKSHPLKNVVTRALGGAAHVAVDLIEVPITAGDRYLLCSDGLTGMVSDDELVQTLGGEDPPDRCVRHLVELANERGGIDNITAILVEVTKHVSDRRPTDPVGVPTSVSTDSTVTVAPITVKKAPAEEPTTETIPVSVSDGPTDVIPVAVVAEAAAAGKRTANGKGANGPAVTVPMPALRGPVTAPAAAPTAAPVEAAPAEAAAKAAPAPAEKSKPTSTESPAPEPGEGKKAASGAAPDGKAAAVPAAGDAAAADAPDGAAGGDSAAPAAKASGEAAVAEAPPAAEPKGAAARTETPST